MATCNTCQIQMVGLEAFSKLAYLSAYLDMFPVTFPEKTIHALSTQAAAGIFCGSHTFQDCSPPPPNVGVEVKRSAAKSVRRGAPICPVAGCLSLSLSLVERTFQGVMPRACPWGLALPRVHTVFCLHMHSSPRSDHELLDARTPRHLVAVPSFPQ